MKLLATCLLIVIPYLSYGQTYSELVDDARIEEILQFDIMHSSKFPEDRKIGSKKVYVGPAYWDGAAPFENIDLKDATNFHEVFRWFIESDTLFSSADKEFMEHQFDAALGENWKWNFKGARLSKRYSIKIYQYSIPLFSKDGNRVMFHKYFYCGSLCC